MIRHKCEDPECIYVGQPTASTCKCHRTSDQMMTARIQALEAALRKIAEMPGTFIDARPIARATLAGGQDK